MFSHQYYLIKYHKPMFLFS